MTVIPWPEVLIPRRCDPELRNFTKGGPPTAMGRQQRVFADAGYWQITLSEFSVATTERVLAWRKLIARLRAGGEVDVVVFDAHSANPGVGLFSATLTAGVALRATSITVLVNFGEAGEGHYLSLDGRYLHVITEVVSKTEAQSIPQWLTTDDPWNDAGGAWFDDDTQGGDILTANVLPPLRAAKASGSPVAFDGLRLRCVLDEMNSGDLSLDVGMFGFPTLVLRESI